MDSLPGADIKMENNPTKKYHLYLQLLALAALFTVLYLLPLGVRPVIIPDESRYAEIPREMLMSGDWIVPHLNGLRYFEKPVMGYWLNAISIMSFGANAFAIRFPSAIAAAVSALMVFFLLRRFSKNDNAGILAAAVFLTFLEVFAVHTFSVLDGILSMFLTVAIVLFYFGYMSERFIKRSCYLALSGAFCGMAFLTKGFLAFVVPVVVIVPFLIWEKRWKDIVTIPWIPVVTAIAVVTPWALMIASKEGDFWHYFIWTEHIKRFMSDSAQHPEAFWFFLPVVMAGALPWSALLPAAISGLDKPSFSSPLIRFVVCWFVAPLVFFSASRGKLPTYILPCFPPLAALIAVGLLNYGKRGRKRLFSFGVYSLLALTAISSLILILGKYVSSFPLKAYGNDETWKWFLGTAALVAWGACLLKTAKTGDFRKRLLLFFASPLLFFMALHFILPATAIRKKAPGEFLLKHEKMISPETILVSDSDTAHPVCWFYKRNDLYLTYSPGELAYGLNYEDASGRFLTLNQLIDLIRGNSPGRGVILIMKANRYSEFSRYLPAPTFEDSNGGFVLAGFKQKGGVQNAVR